MLPSSCPCTSHVSNRNALQVADIEDDRVVCRATNSATLDGLLTVMLCHTCDEVGDREGRWVHALCSG